MDFQHFLFANLDYFLLLGLGLILGIFLVKNKKKVEFQKILFPVIYLILYKTKIGLNAMDSLSKRISKRWKEILSYSSITIGFIGMAFITYAFSKSALLGIIDKLRGVGSEMVVAVLLPSNEQIIPGLPPLHFLYWIIAIFVLATVHEFSHGLFARMHNIKVKSSGFAFLGIILPIIPAAFVEPDEEGLEKASKKIQLAVLSAGAFANFITSVVFFILLMFIAAPISSQMISQEDGIVIASIVNEGPSDNVGIELNSKLLKINGEDMYDLSDIFLRLNQTSPYEKIEIETNQGVYYITLGEHPEKDNGYMGMQFLPSCRPENYAGCSGLGVRSLGWIYGLVAWLFFINLMVGLINLLPLGIVDGGRMFYLAVLAITKNEKISKKIFGVVSIILLMMLLFFLLPALFNYFIAPFLG
jgi:membrane-associated protease RseP (regulator of RpoE activity)